MDFRSLLQSMTTLSEESKVHKGTYGTSYGKEDVRDQYGHRVGKVDKDAEAKKDAPKKGRGRPKKDGGDEKKFDTKGLQDFMTGGKKPNKDIGKVSKKHSLKEYFDEVSSNKQLDEMMPQQPIPVVGKQGSTQSTGAGFLNIDDNSPAGQAIQKALGDLAKQKKAQIVVPTTQQPTTGTTNAPQATGSAMGVSVQEEGEKWIQKAVKHPGAFSAKAKAAGKSVAAFAKEKEHAPGTLGKQARLAQTLRKMHEESLDQPATMEAEGPMLNSPAGGLGAGRDPKVLEKKDMPGNQERLDVAPPKGKLTAADFAKLRAKKKVSESVVMEGYGDLLDNLIAKIDSAGFKSAYNIKGYTPDQAEEKILNKIHGDDEFKMLSPANQKHLAKMAVQHYSTEHQLDETDMEEGFKPTIVPPQNIPAVARKSMGAEPLKLGDLTRTSNISDPENLKLRGRGIEPKPLGLTMKDIKFESWDKQLNNLLNEGITVSSSTGQQGSPDSVTVSATDGDADQLLQVLRQAGVGVFGGNEQEHSGYGAPVSDVEPEGHGQEPEVAPEVVGDGDDMLALIKKMTGIEAGPEGTAEVDYEDEEDADTGTEGSNSEATKADEKSDKGTDGSDEESEDSDGDSKEEVDEAEVEEGNRFTYNLLKAREAGESEADLDGDGDMEKVKEGEEQCNECGMYESDCGCDHEQMNEFANDAGGDGTAEQELLKLKALLSMGNDLNKPKRDQTVLNPTQVNVAEALNDWKKLSGIK